MNALAWLSSSHQARFSAWSFAVGKRGWNRWIRLSTGIRHGLIALIGALLLLLTTAGVILGFLAVLPLAGALFDLAKQTFPHSDSSLWLAAPVLVCLVSFAISIRIFGCVFRLWFHWLGPQLNKELSSAFDTSPLPTDPVFQSALPYAKELIACSRLEWAMAKHFWNPQNQARLLHQKLEATLSGVATHPIKKNRL